MEAALSERLNQLGTGLEKGTRRLTVLCRTPKHTAVEVVFGRSGEPCDTKLSAAPDSSS